MRLHTSTLLTLTLLITSGRTHTHGENHNHDSSTPHSHSTPSSTIPLSTREHWIRRANAALTELQSPCPFGAFGTAIVNHTDVTTSAHGKLICLGVNDVRSGNPLLHGETAAMINCTAILRRSKDEGGHGLSGEETGLAWRDLTLYTNGEPCPMCTTAIRWAGFKELVYSVSAPTLTKLGWPQIDLRTREIFERSRGVLGTETVLIPRVLEDESMGWFEWQYAGGACPSGCVRGGGRERGECVPVEGRGVDEL